MTAEKLRQKREELKITQALLAEMLGINRRTIGRWESGKATIPQYLDYIDLKKLYEAYFDKDR